MTVFFTSPQNFVLGEAGLMISLYLIASCLSCGPIYILFKLIKRFLIKQQKYTLVKLLKFIFSTWLLYVTNGKPLYDNRNDLKTLKNLFVKPATIARKSPKEG